MYQCFVLVPDIGQDGKMMKAIGIPIEQFEDVVSGLINTLNLMENEQIKKIIEDKLKEKKIPFDIRYGYNYYMDCK